MFLEHHNEVSVLKWPLQSPFVNLIKHLWGVMEQKILFMDVQLTNLQRLCDQYGPESLRIASSTLLNLCHEDLRQSF